VLLLLFVFLLGQISLIALLGDITYRGSDPGNDRPWCGRHFGLTVAGLAIAWLTMLALIGPLLVDHEIHESNSAIAAANSAPTPALAAEGVESAIEHANTARSIEPWAATPYVQLGLLAQVQGETGTAISRFQQAIDRERKIRSRAGHLRAPSRQRPWRSTT